MMNVLERVRYVTVYKYTMCFILFNFCCNFVNQN